jgi:peptidoglycan/xylan/chitin deacetylase (PgdA/CDA1 family)
MAKKGVSGMMINSLNFEKPVYVLIYHPWMDGFEKCFTIHLSWLRENGFKSIPLEHLLQYLKGEEVLIPERPIAITLDDGTIENYTLAYPLLKKYGFTGTVFAPTADKYIDISGKDWWKEVEGERVLKIEGHSHTHSFIFINDHVDDFYIRECQDREPIIKGLDPRPGAPLFGLGYEFVSKRFFPDRKLINRCVDYARQQGFSFFEKEHWKEELMGVVSTFKGDLGRFETEEEKGRRLDEELRLSKKMIEETFGNGKEVQFFAYPFGACHSDLFRHLKQSGYVGAFTTEPGGNKKGDHPFLIKRMTILNEDSFGGLADILKEYL